MGNLINKSVALEYCGGMEELFLEIVEDYKSADEINKLKEAYANSNWNDYRVYAHALKSASLTIGAESVSEAFKGLEFAVKEDNLGYIPEHHDEACNLFEELVKEIENLLK